MKTTHFLGLGLALLTVTALSSCSKDDNNSPENPAEKGTAISFGNPFVNKTSRSAITTADLDRFRVYGYINTPDFYLFDGILVSKHGNQWTYDDIQYWYGGNTYYFSAVAPVDDDASYQFTPLTPQQGANEFGGGNITINIGADEGGTDLIYAFRKESIPETGFNGATVRFEFNHLLSQVRLAFQNDMPAGTSIEINNVRIENIIGEGTINTSAAFDDMAWVGSAYSRINIPVDMDEDDAMPGAKAYSEGLFVIPTIESQPAFDIAFTVNVKNAGANVATYFHKVTVKPFNMVKGYSYNFLAKLNTGNINPDGALYPIEFDVQSVSDWEEDEGPIDF